jgi:hypothetical protein
VSAHQTAPRPVLFSPEEEMSASTEDIPDLLSLLKRYSTLQVALVHELKAIHTTCIDWEYLFGLPKSGEVTVAGEKWEFHVHGVGVAFIEPLSGLRVNCHVGIQEHPSAFDSGRIVEFLQSFGQTKVRFNDNMVKFGFSDGSLILAELCDRKLINRCDDLPGQHYELAWA